jgi:hypothetical protein
VTGVLRLALEVGDAGVTTQALTGAGARHLKGPVVTPWGDRNAGSSSPVTSR